MLLTEEVRLLLLQRVLQQLLLVHRRRLLLRLRLRLRLDLRLCIEAFNKRMKCTKRGDRCSAGSPKPYAADDTGFHMSRPLNLLCCNV